MGTTTRGDVDAKGSAMQQQQERDAAELVKDDTARAPEKVPRHGPDAAAALETMIQSTRRLDEILERMCADEKHGATSPPDQYARSDWDGLEAASQMRSQGQREALGKEKGKGTEEDSDSDTGFEDCCSGVETEKVAAPSCFPTARTVAEYFQFIEDVFRASDDGVIATTVELHGVQAAAASTLKPDNSGQFARLARVTGFVFPSLAYSSTSLTGFESVDFMELDTTELIAAVAPEYNVTYDHFVARLKEELLACDHLIPSECAEAVAKQGFFQISAQEGKLLETVNTLFPLGEGLISEGKLDHWIQRNILCKISVEESEQNRQWGLLLRLQVNSNLAPQVQTQQSGPGGLYTKEESITQGPSLASCTSHTVFLPKRYYNELAELDSVLQVAMGVKLRMAGVSSSSTRVSEDESPQTSQPNQEEESSWTNPSLYSSTAQLPEMVNVSWWGQHDDIPTDRVNQNESSIRKIPEKAAIRFTRLEIETPFPRNRIVQAACSRYHTLFLNDMGLVFACGHAMDGALGLGPECHGYVAEPTMVEYFFDSLVVVRHISCGGDHLGGAHSAAVTQEGRVYTWGVGIALGNGALRSVATPKRIHFPRIEDSDTRSRTSGEADATETESDDTSSATTIASVTCGSGFCVALTPDGHAFSWGKWSDGRLGLGKIPVIARTSRRGGGAVRRQYQSFQLTPKLILGASATARFLKVACGDAHCVAVTLSGQLATWGRGNSGQLGRGDANDAMVPTSVFQSTHHHGNGRGEEYPNLKWRDVGAGVNWSMALSGDGRMWSWGACGSAVLGHGSGANQNTALLAETILQRHQRLFTQSRKHPSSTPCPTLPRLRWMTPQLIPCFSETDTRICRLSAGAQHAAAISVTGDLYIWGEAFGDDDNQALTSLPTLVNSGQRPDAAVVGDAEVDIGTRSVEYVVCGGRQVIAFTTGSFLARSMTVLYHDCIAPPHGAHGKAGSVSGADIALVVSGKKLLAHKLLLARRSPVLRALIMEEEQHQLLQLAHSEDDSEDRNFAGNSSEPMELLLPRLRADVARALVEFIYTDNLSIELNPHGSYYLIRDVLRAAKIYRLPSLVELCRERLFSASTPSLLGDSENQSDALVDIIEDEDFAGDDPCFGITNADIDNYEGDSIPTDGAAHSLNDDMKSALVESNWSDTTLVAEGHEIPVHRCMLVARSDYFRAALAFRREANATPSALGSKMATVIHVEDSYAGILRVLHFIYHDQVTLPISTSKEDEVGWSGDNEDEGEDESSEQLLEDLLAADKYGLDRMKRLCEHAVHVTENNCLEVLAVAELVHASHLKQVAMQFVVSRLGTVTARQEEFHRFQTDFPHLMQEIYASIRDASREESLLREWHKAVGESLEDQRKKQELQWNVKSAAAPFPWVPLTLAIAFGGMFLSMMHAQEHEYSGVSAVNIAALAGVVGAVLLGWV